MIVLVLVTWCVVLMFGGKINIWSTKFTSNGDIFEQNKVLVGWEFFVSTKQYKVWLCLLIPSIR